MRRSSLWLLTSTCVALAVAACSDSVSAPKSLSAIANASAKAGASGYAPQTATSIPVFVVGDSESHGVGATVNFWGAQWWKNNQMTGIVDDGVARFKGFAPMSSNMCGGTWASLPGNSPKPPSEIGNVVAVIVTSNVQNDGPNISGTIKQILLVKQDGGYGPNPGHSGSGVVSMVVCGGSGEVL